MRNQSVRVLLALTLGLALGVSLATWGNASAAVVSVADAIGTLWTNAIRMTVIPLVAALTIASVAGTGASADLRRAMTRALVVFLILLVSGGVLALVIGQLAFADFVLPADVAARVRGSATAVGASPTLPSLGQRIIDMVPSNPIKSAADGALLPLVVFTLALGFALKQAAPERRDAVLSFCRGIADALLVVVGWVVAIAPLGVGALAFALGARLGVSSLGALARYIATLAVVLMVFTALFAVVSRGDDLWAHVVARIRQRRGAGPSARGRFAIIASSVADDDQRHARCTTTRCIGQRICVAARRLDLSRERADGVGGRRDLLG